MIKGGKCRMFERGITAHCAWCLSHAGDGFPKKCPHGVTASSIKQRPGLGDVVERLAKPIAKVLGLSCLDAHGALKPGSECARRRDWLNRLGPPAG